MKYIQLEVDDDNHLVAIRSVTKDGEPVKLSFLEVFGAIHQAKLMIEVDFIKDYKVEHNIAVDAEHMEDVPDASG
jgi:hypothetical protein